MSIMMYKNFNPFSHADSHADAFELKLAKWQIAHIITYLIIKSCAYISSVFCYRLSDGHSIQIVQGNNLKEFIYNKPF